MADELPSNYVEVDGVAYCIGPVPDRRHVALMRQQGTYTETVAWFHSELDAERFRAWFIALGKAAGSRRTEAP